MRIYLPRNRHRMTNEYDMIGLDDTTYSSFPSQNIQWMTEGCKEDGLRLFMAGGFESFGGYAGFGSWDNTVLSEVLPVKCRSEYLDEGRNVVLEDKKRENTLMRSVPWEGYEQHDVFGGYNAVELKQGAEMLSKVVRLGSGGGGEDPGWVWWDVGEGRFFASAPGFRGGSAGKEFMRWKHYPDFVSNMVYFLAGLEPPSDVNLLYQTRSRFRDIYDQRQTVIHLLDFIARFDAKTDRVDDQLAKAREIADEAREEFVDLDLQNAKEKADQAFELLDDAYDLALRARDEALYWIFLTEWLVVTGTGLICGVLVWTLMVRRQLYREVKVTRGGRY